MSELWSSAVNWFCQRFVFQVHVHGNLYVRVSCKDHCARLLYRWVYIPKRSMELAGFHGHFDGVSILISIELWVNRTLNWTQILYLGWVKVNWCFSYYLLPVSYLITRLLCLSRDFSGFLFGNRRSPSDTARPPWQHPHLTVIQSDSSPSRHPTLVIHIFSLSRQEPAKSNLMLSVFPATISHLVYLFPYEQIQPPPLPPKRPSYKMSLFLTKPIFVWIDLFTVYLRVNNKLL